MAAYYNIDDGFGNRITAGLQPHEARRVAKRIASERGESVFLYEAGKGEADAEMEEITPSSKSPSRHHATKVATDELVTIETMPDYLRASHRAARNWGVYPHNGAVRERVSREEAEEIVASDPDGYARIVTPRTSKGTTTKSHHATKKTSRSKKTWHIFETGRATGDRWVAGPYVTKSRAEELALRYMIDPPGRDSLRRSGVYIVKDHGP